MFIYLGNPTRFAPIPRPAPERAFTAMEGTYVSRILNVAAAVSEIKATSSMLRERLGDCKCCDCNHKTFN